MESLISTEWLSAELGAPGLVVLDATLFLPAHGRDARAEYEAEHIPGAAFMDLARFSPLPEPERLREMLAEIGVSAGVRAVVYDDSPLQSAARGWWLIRHAGFEASVLDGGMTKWRAAKPPRDGKGDHAKHNGGGSRPAAVVPFPVPGRITKEDLLASKLAIADARSPARFRGEEPEPRPGVAAGHMPGARNLPHSTLFAPDGTYLRGDALRSAFTDAGIDLDKPLITTCGSGVTAAVLSFGAHLLGKTDVRLYDGSWAEWGADASTPKVLGAA